MSTTARCAVVPLSIFFVLACSAPSAWALNLGTISNGGARITINFASTKFDDTVLFTGELPAIQGIVLQDMAVDVNLGGLRRQYVLDANGQSVKESNFFEIRNTGTALVFTMNTQAADLEKTFSQEGLINKDADNEVVSVNGGIQFNNTLYTATLQGVYAARINQAGKAFLGTIKPPKDPFKPVVHIKTIHATPNPTLPGQAISLIGHLSLKDLTGNITSQINWGDGSAPLRMPGADMQTMLKTGIAHTYVNAGVFTCRIHIMGENEIIATRVFIIVGKETVVNSTNGLIAQLQKGTQGSVTVNLNVDGIPGAVGANTFFKDLNGNPAGSDPGVSVGIFPNALTGTPGMSPSRIFAMPGIFVAETTALDMDGNPLGVVRKTIAVSAADVGMSMAARDNAAAGSRDTPDPTITLNSMHGKFLFTSSKLDKVTFTGTIILPAGFAPKNAAGNDLTIAMGNVIDTIHLDEKTHLVLPTTTGRITRFRMAARRLPNGVATGVETAKVNITLNVADLDVLGFDSEGITVSVRSDEEGMSPVARFIQVDMLISGQTFSAVVPVDYSVGSSDAFGSVRGRQ